jgi:hypothetical protein
MSTAGGDVTFRSTWLRAPSLVRAVGFVVSFRRV